MKIRVLAVMGWLAAMYGAVGAQTVTFNGPTEWMTIGDPTVTAKMLLDTAGIEKKQVRLTLVKVGDGRRRVLANKTVKVEDYSQEMALTKLPGAFVGGTDYLKIEWSIPGKTGEEGTLEPFGYVALDESKIPLILRPRRVAGAIDAEAVKAMADELEYGSVAGRQIGAVWNDRALALVCTKSAEGGAITVAVDGKNGKNAFLSYADWFATASRDADSLETYHYTRTAGDEGIEYTKKPWRAGAKRIETDGMTVVVVPWHDLGIIPFVNRRFGLAVFASDGEGTTVGSLPETAMRDVPGTWGDCELRDGDGKRDE